MFTKKMVYCPVGNHVELGYRAKGQAVTFICRECRFAFPIDKEGNLGVPIKLDSSKNRKAMRYCTSEGCVCHDD